MTKLTALCYATLLLAGFTSSCRAIDNPDAPDHVADFQQRVQVFEAASQQAKTTRGSLKAYADYEQFLDTALNKTYKSVLAKLGAAQQAKMKESQRNWVKYRDSEFGFVAENWTTKNFGSSATISRGAYRTAIVRDRVTLLLGYLKNY